MSLTILSASQAIHQISAFDAVIDARSEDEYRQDRLPGAINWPTLNNQERQQIGTIYKQVNPFEARKRGAALAAHNIAAHIDREVIDKPKDWRPLTYCWRGGQRSGSLALILSQIGFRVSLIEGGYKAFRAAMVLDIPRLLDGLQFQVICGPTGSGKTRLLNALTEQGAQVLDLEALASHRSSVLGAMTGLEQPTQKRFDSLIWDVLRGFDPSQTVYVESESKKVGNVALPEALVQTMRRSPCLNVYLPDAERVALLLEDYAHLVRNVDYFCDRLAVLTAHRGKAMVARWQALARENEFAPVVQDLLAQHYDPSYSQSMQRNFCNFENAISIVPDDRSAASMARLATKMLKKSV